MIKSTLSATSSKMVLLAPKQTGILGEFHNVMEDLSCHDKLLKSAQRLRGKIYHDDGAIAESQLDEFGGFPMEADVDSWHLLLVDDDRVLGCARYFLHPSPVTYHRLLVRNCAIARNESEGRPVRSAIESQIRYAGDLGFHFVEMGGWALAEEIRGSSAALKCMAASYAWAQLMGGCLGLCTATVRHGSASILSRVGGVPLRLGPDQMPSYYDPAYNCEMQILAFDSRTPRLKFASLVGLLREELSQTPVIVRPADSAPSECGDTSFSSNLVNLRNAIGSAVACGVESCPEVEMLR